MRVEGRRCRVEGRGLRVEGVGLRVEGLTLRVEGLRVEGVGLRVEGVGLRVEGLTLRVEGWRVEGLRVEVEGAWQPARRSRPLSVPLRTRYSRSISRYSSATQLGNTQPLLNRYSGVTEPVRHTCGGALRIALARPSFPPDPSPEVKWSNG